MTSAEKVDAAIREELTAVVSRYGQQLDRYERNRDAGTNTQFRIMTLAAGSAGLVVPLLGAASPSLGVRVGFLKSAAAGFILTLVIGVCRMASLRLREINDMSRLLAVQEKGLKVAVASAAFRASKGPMTPLSPEVMKVVDEWESAQQEWEAASTKSANADLTWDGAFYTPYIIGLVLVLLSFSEC